MFGAPVETVRFKSGVPGLDEVLNGGLPRGPHESTIRELILRPGGVSVSEPLDGFSGVLTGNPVYLSGPSQGEAHGH